MILNCSDFVNIFGAWHRAFEENKENLVKLDSVGGDGDLGLAMSDGFTAVQQMLAENSFEDVGELLYHAGKTISETASSSLGTLLAFGFMASGKAVRGRKELEGKELGDVFGAFEDVIAMRGGAKVGDKTFLDGFDPAVRILKEVSSEEDISDALQRAAAAAKEGSDSTVDMVAKFGRIAVRGEGSRGILDPGSVVASILMSTLSEVLAAN